MDEKIKRIEGKEIEEKLRAGLRKCENQNISGIMKEKETSHYKFITIDTIDFPNDKYRRNLSNH